MLATFLVVLVFVGLAFVPLALGGAAAQAVDSALDRRDECPLCWESIPANATVCPKCKAKL
jgi:hypothetical protein